MGDTAVFSWTGFHGVWALPDAACPSEWVAGPGSEEVAPAADGGSWSVTFDSPGAYTYACQVDGHCAAGMIISFNVEA